MDKFVVSARKYRPQTFDTVVGQAHITTTLKNAIKNQQLAHAFLFCGPRGVGKTTCARILAKTINCERLQSDGEACDKCSSCRTFNEGSSLNIHELDAASNNSVDDIRSLVEQVRFTPQAGRYKVYIVDEVHMLSSSAFNAFLKTLEEPPSYAIFILATTEKHKILPTILSRCQIFDFKRITSNDTVLHLESIIQKEHIKAEKSALQIIAQKSEGCMRDSLSILDKIVSFTNGEVTYQNTLEHLNILDSDYYFKLLESLEKQDLATTLLLYDEINRKGFEGDLVMTGFAEFLRNILVCKDARAAELLDVMEGMQNKYKSTAANTSTAYIVSALNLLNEAELNFKMARNKRLHVELLLIKLNFLQQAIDFSIENDTVVKKKLMDSPVLIKAKPIQSFQLKSTKSAPAEPKLYVEVPTPPVAPTPLPQTVTSKPALSKTMIPAEKTKESLLDGLRKKYGSGGYNVEMIPDAESLELEKLKICWNDYANILEKQQKHSAANTFRNAVLQIESENRFVVTVGGNIQHRFIEQEKMVLTGIIQELFHNRTITMQTIVQVSEEKEEIPTHLTMNSRQRFEKMSAQNSWIKELKDELNLGLDY